MWNCINITKNDLPLTNNIIESWHNAIQYTFNCLYSNIYKLVEALIQENFRFNAIYVCLDAGENFSLYTRREYQQSNNLRSLLEEYGENVMLIISGRPVSITVILNSLCFIMFY